MTSMTNAGDGDLWTATAQALGIRTTGKRSPFRELETREDALGLVRDCSIALLLVGLVQVSLAWLAGMGSALDALVYMPLAGALYRYSSRLAAVLLLAFSLFAVAVTVVASLWAVEARTDLILIATLLWSGVRAVEATAFLQRTRLDPKLEELARRKGSSKPWLFFAAGSFVLVVAVKFLVPLTESRHEIAVAPAVAPPHTQSSASSVAAGDGTLRFSPPSGFVDPRSAEAEIGTIADGFVPSGMELRALFVTPAEVDGFRRNHRFAPTRYVMVQSVRAADGTVSAEDFRAAKDGAIASGAARLEKLVGADAALAQWLESVLRAAGTTTELDGTRIRNEGLLEESERSISVGSIVEVSGSAASSSRAVVTSLVLARGEVLVVYTYGTSAKSDDVVATHELGRQVVQNLIHENPA